jgi:hypothetical protein
MKNVIYTAILVGAFSGFANAQNQLPNGFTNNLRAYYQLNGNADDSSGYKNNGIPSNISYQTNRFGLTNSAAYFGYQSGASWVNFGSMGQVLCTGLNSLPNYPITYSVWCNLNSYQTWLGGRGGGVMTIIGKEGSGYANATLAIYNQTDQSITNRLAYLGSTWNAAPFTPNPNQWYHIVFTISDSGLQTFYVNGVQIFQTNTPTILNCSADIPFKIGASSSYGSPNANRVPFNGSISDAAVWSRALSSNEVASLYASQSSYFPFTSDGISISISGYKGIGGSDGLGGSVTIPSTINGLPVTAIAESAFAGQSNITSISIPDGVTSIGSSAFSGCTGLTGITLPDSVISMGMNVFAGCPNLTNVSTSNGLKTFLSQYASELGLSAVAVNNFYSTTEGQLYAMVATSLAGNASFLSSLGTNTSFLGALSGEILATTNNYGLATKADLAALSAYVTNTALPSLQSSLTGLVQQSLPTNNGYLTAVATNPAFISALVSQPSFLRTTATNATFLSSLTTNPAFVAAVATQIQSGSNNYGIAIKQAQSLNFPAIPSLTITPGRKFTNIVTASSGLPVVQTSGNTAVATVSNNVLTLIGAGSTTISASQAGNALWNPITASQTLFVNKGAQTLAFTAIAAQTYVPNKRVTLTSTSSAALNTNTSYLIDNGAIGSISNNIVTLLGTGTATITATNSGNNFFGPAFATQKLIVK